MTCDCIHDRIVCFFIVNIRFLWEIFSTNRALCLMISLFSLHFHANTRLYPTGFTSSSVQTTGPKTSYFVNEFNSTYMVSFHFGQSFLCRHSSIFHGLESQLFLMMSKATWKTKILLTTILFWSNFSPMCTWLIEISQFSGTCSFIGDICLICAYLETSCSICAFSRAFWFIFPL